MRWPTKFPIGKEEGFEGVIDLVAMKAYFFDGDNGEDVRVEEIPDNLKSEADDARAAMLDALSMYSDELMEKMLGEEEIGEQLIHDITRKAVIEQSFTPVFMGSAFKNKGVQPLLDAICRYLPSPLERENIGNDPKEDGKKIAIESDPSQAADCDGFQDHGR